MSTENFSIGAIFGAKTACEVERFSKTSKILQILMFCHVLLLSLDTVTSARKIWVIVIYTIIIEAKVKDSTSSVHFYWCLWSFSKKYEVGPKWMIFFDFQCFSSEFEFFHDFIVLLATVTSAHTTSIIKTIGDIWKYLWDGPKWMLEALQMLTSAW